MAQQHLDRLTSTDASFLHQEGRCSHMHIGGVMLLDGPPPTQQEVMDHIRGRLHLIPRYRQKLATPPFDTGRPLWIDDNGFNLDYHVRCIALPSPGSEAQLLETAALIASQPLDRDKPLWEFWLIEGIEPKPGASSERFALISKNHHALVDGVAGMDLAAALFDFSPEPQTLDTERLVAWKARPEPSPLDMALAGARDALETAAGLTARTLGAATRPAHTVGALRDSAEGLAELMWAALNPAPETPLNVPIGPHRRFAIVRQQLADYKTVKDCFGGTVNDVVLSVVSGALGRWLRSRGIRTEGVEMRALVPVSVRTKDDQGSLGNRLTAMRGPLPVYIRDPVVRLGVVSAAMADLKESKQAIGAATLVAVNDRMPPTVLAQASRIQFSTRLFNLLVTNVPGPQVPLYILGRQLEDMFPLAFLPENNALAVAIMSYNGKVEYGLLGDFDALPDIELIADGIEQSLQELLAVAKRGVNVAAAAGRRSQGPAADMRAKRSSPKASQAPPAGQARPPRQARPARVQNGGGATSLSKKKM
jgi:diacylglycerol O-acyltransferase / wax synthase